MLIKAEVDLDKKIVGTQPNRKQNLYWYAYTRPPVAYAVFFGGRGRSRIWFFWGLERLNIWMKII